MPEVLLSWMTDKTLLMVCGVALVLILLAFIIVLIRRKKLSADCRATAHILEIVVLTLCMLVLAAWMYSDTGNHHLVIANSSLGHEGSVLTSILLGAVLYGVFAVPLLLLIRFLPNRLAVIVCGLGWLITLTFCVYRWKSHSTIREIREADIAGIFKDSRLLGDWIIAGRYWVWALVAVLGGLYAIRRNFSYLRLVAGTYIIGWIAGRLHMPFAREPMLWLAPVCFAAFASILVSLPLQRASLERLLGIQLSRNPGAPSLPYSPVGTAAGHLALVLLCVAIAFSAAANYYELELSRTIMTGRTPVWRSTADQNAFEDMKLYFRKKEGFPVITATAQPADYSKTLSLLDQISSETRGQVLTQLNMDRWNSYLGQIREFTQAFEAASQADYLQMPRGEYPSFLNLREVSRAVGLRSLIALKESRPLDAAEDAGTIIRFGGLLRDHPELVGQMVGVAIRNIGIRVTYNLLANGADDSELLNALATMMETVAPQSRIGLDYAEIKTGNPGIMSGLLIPVADMSIPAFARAHDNALICWMNFDLVQLAVGLQRYKLDTGAYPAQLQDLSPTYLTSIPREPIEGREYSYTRKGDGWYELKSLAYKVKWKGDYASQLFMPPMLAPDAESSTTACTKGKSNV